MRRLASPTSRHPDSRRRLFLENLEERSLLTAGMFDPTFGVGGKTTTDFMYSLPPDDVTTTTVIQSDGKIVVSGVSNPDGHWWSTIVRHNPDGSLDNSFGLGGRVTTDILGDLDISFGNQWNPAMTLQASGKILLASGPAVARFNSNGTLDTTFGVGGKTTLAMAGTAVTEQTDGKIIIAGTTADFLRQDFVVARLNSNGSLDTTFGDSGLKYVDFLSDNEYATDVVVQPDGKIVVVGTSDQGEERYFSAHAPWYSTYPGSDFAVVRLTSSGQQDESFGYAGVGLTTIDLGFSFLVISEEYATSVAVTPDGAILVGGYRYSEGDSFNTGAVVRLQSGGDIDTNFALGAINGGGGGRPTRTGVRDIAVQPDGMIVVALADGESISRLTSDGNPDASFSSSIGGSEVALQSDGKIVVSGTSTYSTATGTDFVVARVSSSGAVDTAFGSGGTATTNSSDVHHLASGSDVAGAVAVQSDGKVIIAGKTSLVGDDFAVVRYKVDGSLDTSFGTNGQVVIDFGGFDDFRAAVLQPDGKIVLVGTSNVGDFNSPDAGISVVRLNVDGTLDSSFGINGKQRLDQGPLRLDNVNAIALQTDGKIVLAGSAVIRLNTDGSLDNTFGIGGRQTSTFFPLALAVQSDNKIVLIGGAQSSTTGVDFAVARLNSNGSMDTSFDADGIQSIDFGGGAGGNVDQARGVVLQPDGKIVVVGWSNTASNSENTFAVARLNSNGSLDSGFGSGGKQTVEFGNFGRFNVGRVDVALQSDGKLVVAGMSSGINLVARLSIGGALDNTFGTLGTQLINQGYVNAFGGLMALAPDGRIVLAGSGDPVSTFDFTVARLLGDPQVVGTPGDDSIQIDSGSETGSLSITINGVIAYQDVPEGAFIIDAIGGDDTIIVNTSVPGGVIVNGGDGADQFVVNLGDLPGPVGVLDSGASGDDTLTVNGTAGDDVIEVKNGRVTFGNPVNETVGYYGMEFTTIDAGDGNDTIIDPESEHLTLLGGSGNDTIIIQDTASGGVTADGGQGADSYVVNGGNLQGSITIADSGTTETDTVRIVGTPGTDALVQTNAGFLLNGTAIVVDGLESATLDGGGGNDELLVEGTPPIPDLQDLWGPREVTIDILPESLNVDSNGTLTVVIFGAIDFDAAQIDVGSVLFAGASAWHSVLVDANGDGRLDLQLKFRTQDTILGQIYADLLVDDHDADGVLDSTQQEAQVAVTGETLDDALFSGSDNINLFLAGRSLRNLLAELFE